MVTSNMTRSIPSSHYSFCPIPSRHCIADRRLLSIIAKTALGNSNRIIELQTPHFVKRIIHMKIAWGYRPKFATDRSNRIAAINHKARPRDRRLSEPSDQKLGLGRLTTTRRQPRTPAGVQNYAAKSNRKRPSQRFLFWTSRRTALYIKLLFGCRCLLHN